MKTPMLLVALTILLVSISYSAYAHSSHFALGDVAEVQNSGSIGLKVRDAACLSGYWDGTRKYDGARGSILASSVSCDGYTWWKIRWSDGREGWTAEGDLFSTWLRKVSITASTKFVSNDRVQANSNVNARSGPPDLAYIYTVSSGAQGTVVGGPYYGVPKGSSGFYHFWQVNFAGTSEWFAESFLTKITTSVPTAPQNLRVSSVGDGFVNLAWDPPSSNGGSAVTNYEIYRGTSSGGETYYTTISSSWTTFSNTIVTNGVTYYYKVKAVNAIGTSGFSNEVSATPQALPSPPTHVSPSDGATIQTTTPTLTWNSASNANYYGLYIRNVDTGVLVFDSEVNYGPVYGTSFTLPSGILQNNGNYRWNMRSHNSAGWGTAYSTAWYFYVRITSTPSAPQNFAATPGNSRVDLSWSAPSSDGGSAIIRYNIYRGTSSTSLSLSAQTTLLAFADTGLTNGVTYYYKVTAVNANGEGQPTSILSATPQASTTVPSAPQNLVATPGNTQISLSWQAPLSNGGSTITNYKIYRGTSSSSLSYVTSTTQLSYSDAGLTNGITYYYQVSAVNSVGEGSKSNTASATPQSSVTAPSAPQNLVAAGGNNVVDLSWSAPASNGGSSITNYKIYRGISSGGETLYFTTTTTGTTFSNTNVQNGVIYYYKVTAVNLVGESTTFSNEANATPNAPPPPPTSGYTIANLIDQYAAENYNSAWNIDITQYKAWLAVIAKTEGGRGEFVAHSQGLLGSDKFNHKTLGSKFTFSTGIGPWQIDNGGADSWELWSTLKKLDPVETIKSTAHIHNYQYGTGSTLDTFARSSRWCGVNYVYTYCGTSEAELASAWYAVTGTSWEDNKNIKRVLDWLSIKTQLNQNRNLDASYENNVKSLGSKNWNIPSSAKIYTNTGKAVVFKGSYQTWLITARDGAGNKLFNYYYILDTTKKIEVWVFDDQATAGSKKLRNIFYRDYNNNQYPSVSKGTTTAGLTLKSAALNV